MFRLFVLSLICWTVFGVSDLKAGAADSGNIISKNDACVLALTVIKEVKFSSQYADFMALEDEEAEAFVFLWNRNPDNQNILRALSNKVRGVKNRNNGQLNDYENNLVDAIFLFISKMKVAVERSEMDDILPHYIQNVINSFDQLSPVQMFMYTYVINEAAQRLGYNNKFNFSELLSAISLNDLPDELQDDFFMVFTSSEQIRHIFQQYHQLLGSRQVAERTYQNSYRSEEEMIEQGHDPALVRGLDHINSGLQLAQNLLRRSFIDITTTHIQRFADRIDDRIGFIRKGIIDSQDISESNRMRRLELLDALESKAQSYKESRRVTYLYWLTLHLHLSVVASFDVSLLDDSDLKTFILRKPKRNNIDFNDERFNDVDFAEEFLKDFLKEWMMNDDGADLFKLVSVFNLFHEYYLYRDHTHTTDNSDKINEIAENLGLGITAGDIESLDAELENDILLINELGRRAGLDLDIDPESLGYHGRFFLNIDRIFAFSNRDGSNFLGITGLIYLLRQFPQRIVLPTVHGLGIISVNKAHRSGLHFINLANHPIQTSEGTLSPFKVFLRDIDSNISDVDDDNPHEALTQFQRTLERLPVWERGLMERWYFEYIRYQNPFWETTEEEQKQALFDLIKKENLTESEKLDIQRIMLVVAYFALVADDNNNVYEMILELNRVEEEENTEFTEENVISNGGIFRMFLSELLSS